MIKFEKRYLKILLITAIKELEIIYHSKQKDEYKNLIKALRLSKIKKILIFDDDYPQKSFNLRPGKLLLETPEEYIKPISEYKNLILKTISHVHNDNANVSIENIKIVTEYKNDNNNFSKKFNNYKLNFKNIFIGISYDNKFKKIEKAIKKSIENAGFKPIIVREQISISNGTIDNKIEKLLHECKYGVFELTSIRKVGVNHGAIFECGYAMGLKMPIIIVCNLKKINKLHFDINHRDVLLYKDNFELQKKLLIRIEKLFKV